MNLVEILEKLELSFSELSEEEIQELVKRGEITSDQAEKILSEIKKADKIWKLAKPGLELRQFPD